jgi:hypothetical protein
MHRIAEPFAASLHEMKRRFLKKGNRRSAMTLTPPQAGEEVACRRAIGRSTKKLKASQTESDETSSQ